MNSSTLDGHTGVDWQEIESRQTFHFRLVLSRLHTAKMGDFFITHITPNNPTIQRNFLSWVGFQAYTGLCPFHSNKCSWITLAISRVGMYDSSERFRMMTSGFAALANGIDELFSLRNKFDEILGGLQLASGKVPIFNVPADISANPGEIPAWVDDVKTPELKALETQKKDLESRIADLSSFFILLSGTDDPLVQGVVASFRRFGLKAEKTEKGATIDVLAWVPDNSCRFGIEVTGINDSIKKSSNKLTQILQFEQNREPKDKGILLANTYNQTPISDRPPENFTGPAAEFLRPHPILLMTGFDLYRLVQDVIAEKKAKEEVVETLRDTVGVYTYS
jgi:hypothetical protein